MSKTLSITCAALAALMCACSNAPAPVADTRDADLRAVKDLETAWVKDSATGSSPDKWAGYFADDGVGLYPGMTTLKGRDAIKGAMAPFLADPNFALNFQSTGMDESKGGDMIYSYGTYTMTVTDPKTKKPVNDKGKYLTVYRKQADGNWKAVVDTFNSDTAM